MYADRLAAGSKRSAVKRINNSADEVYGRSRQITGKSSNSMRMEELCLRCLGHRMTFYVSRTDENPGRPFMKCQNRYGGRLRVLQVVEQAANTSNRIKSSSTSAFL